MMEKKPPYEPVNTITEKCEVIILGIKRTVLKISPHFQKRNKEFKVSKKPEIAKHLDHWLLDKEIIKNFVQQLNHKEPYYEGINKEWEPWKYYGYQPVIDPRNGMAYRILFFLDDENPEFIGVITVYPS